MMPAMRSFFSRETMEMRRTSFVELLIDVRSLEISSEDTGAALGVAQSDFFADESGGLGREFLGEIGLEDGFFGSRRRKVLAGDGVEGAVARKIPGRRER